MTKANTRKALYVQMTHTNDKLTSSRVQLPHLRIVTQFA